MQRQLLVCTTRIGGSIHRPPLLSYTFFFHFKKTKWFIGHHLAFVVSIVLERQCVSSFLIFSIVVQCPVLNPNLFFFGLLRWVHLDFWVHRQWQLLQRLWHWQQWKVVGHGPIFVLSIESLGRNFEIWCFCCLWVRWGGWCRCCWMMEGCLVVELFFWNRWRRKRKHRLWRLLQHVF